MRVGWIAASGAIHGRLARLKMDTDLHSAALPQRLAAAWLADGRHARHLERVLPLYRQRRDLLLDALQRHLADEATWTVPHGGQHAWVALGRGLPARRRDPT
jgi:GntR family transcriptional regulator of abcA and norABC